MRRPAGSAEQAGEGDGSVNLTPDRQRLVREHLREILASEAFRGSRRSSDFLRFVVEKALAGEQDEIKERTIGVKVYGRREDYDPAEDPVVRLRANEVRKRLAQYYLQSDQLTGPVRIELPAGHYVPHFHFRDGVAPATAPPAGVRARRMRLLAPAAAGVLALAMAGYWMYRSRADQGVLPRFWSPALRSSEAVLICLAHPVVYALSPEVHKEFLDNLARTGQEPSGPYVVRLDRATIPARDIVPIPDQYVGVGDAYSAALLTRLFTEMGKSSKLRIGSDTSFTDLRSYPAVLLGANSNRWTMTVTRELPFVFRRGFGAFYIEETSGARRNWKLNALEPNGKTPEDYALVTRLLDSPSGRMIVAAGGITQYGTHAAGEFLTNPQYLSQILAGAPENWHARNMQCVLHTRVVAGAPGPPRLVAIRFW